VLPALVLTAGLGTRLRPLSLVRAKGAVPVAGVPLVRRVITWLASHGVEDVVLNLHHLPETITRVVGDGSDLGVRVRYSWEDPVLGSAGGPRHALPLLDAQRFLIVNGDTLTDVDLPGMLAQHEISGASVTMALVANPRPDHYGGVLVDGSRVVGFARRGRTTPNHHFVGVQIAERALFEPLPDNVPAESVAALYPAAIAASGEAGCLVGAFVSDASFDDIGTPADYFETSHRIARREGVGDVQAGEGCTIASDARLTRCILWDDVSVESGVELTDCVVTDGARVPSGTRLTRHALVATDRRLERAAF
jgi:NDP-sugar pyrophosphorylase family protein